MKAGEIWECIKEDYSFKNSFFQLGMKTKIVNISKMNIIDDKISIKEVVQHSPIVDNSITDIVIITSRKIFVKFFRKIYESNT